MIKVNDVVNANGELSPILRFFSTILVEDEINTENIFYKLSEHSFLKNRKRIIFNFYEGNLKNSIFDYKSIGNAKIKINKPEKLIKILNFTPTSATIQSDPRYISDAKYKCRSLILDYLEKEYITKLNEKYYLEIENLNEFEPFKIETKLHKKKISLENYISKIQ